MRKCRADEVPAPMITLAGQCVEGVQFNWENYLCAKFLPNCHKAQEQGKMFHYAWILLSIVLVAWKLLEHSPFLSVTLDLPKGVKYAFLWATKDAQMLKESNIFWVLMEMSIRMGINRKSGLSPPI